MLWQEGEEGAVRNHCPLFAFLLSRGNYSVAN